MTPQPNSLTQYKSNLVGTTTGNHANNFNRNHEATSPCRQGGLYYGIDTTSKPLFGWGNTKDTILSGITNYGSTGSAKKTSTTDVLTGITAGVTTLATLSTTAAAVAKAFGWDNKKSADESADVPEQSNLSSCTDTANNLGDDATFDQLNAASKNLGDSMKLATDEMNEASRAAETAKANLKKVKEKITTVQIKIDNLGNTINEQDDIIRSNNETIGTLEKQLSSGKNSDGTELTDAQKDKIRKQISDLKDANKKADDTKKEAEKNKKAAEKEKAKLVEQQTTLENTIKDNEAKAKKIHSELAAAQTALYSINNRVNALVENEE